MTAPLSDPTLDRVIARLQAYKGQWVEIANATGISYSSLSKLAQGKRSNPAYLQIARLDAFFKVLPATPLGLPPKAARPIAKSNGNGWSGPVRVVQRDAASRGAPAPKRPRGRPRSAAKQ